MNFKDWILRFTGVDLPIGDFARDVKADANFPREITDWSQLENHILTVSSGQYLDVIKVIYEFYSASNAL